MQSNERQSGFTLIETILYIALFAIIMGAVLMATYRMIESTDKAQVKSLVQNEAQFAIRKYNWLLTGATIDPTSTITSLKLTNPNLPSSSNPIVFTVAGNKSILTLGSTAAVQITSDIAPITASAFSITPASGTSPAQAEWTFTMSNSYYSEVFTAKKLVR